MTSLLRSPRETLDGYVILPRLIDKVRLHARGKLPPAYVAQLLAPEPALDGRFLAFTDLEPEALRAAILSSLDDTAVLAWVERHGRPRTLTAKQAWADTIEAYRPDPERAVRRARNNPAVAARFDVGAISVFDVIDLDEGRIDRPTR